MFSLIRAHLVTRDKNSPRRIGRLESCVAQLALPSESVLTTIPSVRSVVMPGFFRVLLALVPRQYARFPLRRMLQTAAWLILPDRRAARLNRARNPEAHEMPVKMSSDRSGTRRFLRRYAGLYPRLVLRCDALSLQPFCR